MRAGINKHRVDILDPNETLDPDTNEPIATPVVVATMWSQIFQQRGRERLKSAEVTPEGIFLFSMRWRKDLTITRKHRLQFPRVTGPIFDIEDVVNVGMRNRKIELVAKIKKAV